jgi:hypothetical protein
MSYPDSTLIQTVTIGAGASLSGASSKYSGYRLVGLVTASTWDAAKISFAVSNDGTNFFALYDTTAEVQVASTTGAFAIALEPAKFIGWDYIKVRSGLVGAATNQADATIVTLVLWRCSA